jgi:tetratricopeptide (TPR) repeat protein
MMFRRFSVFLPLALASAACAFAAQSPQDKTSGQNTISLAPDPDAVRNAESKAEVNRGRELFRSGKFAEATRAYQAAIQQDGDAAEAYVGLSRVYLKQKKVEDAYATAIRGVQLAPALPDAHAALGEVYFRMGKLFAAKNEFLMPFDAKAPNARAYLGLSRVHSASFDYKTALKLINEAFGLDPDDPDIRSERTFYMPSQERVAAMQNYLQSTDKYHDRNGRADSKYLLAIMQDQQAHPSAPAVWSPQYKAQNSRCSRPPATARPFPVRAWMFSSTVIGPGSPLRLECRKESS